jgi:hypothetical protein
MYVINPNVLCVAEGVKGTWVMCIFNGASGKPGDIPEYVALFWYREL